MYAKFWVQKIILLKLRKKYDIELAHHKYKTHHRNDLYVFQNAFRHEALTPKCHICQYLRILWWCHDMETFSVLLNLFEGNLSVSGGFPSQTAIDAGFDVSLVVAQTLLNKRSCCKRSKTP